MLHVPLPGSAEDPSPNTGTTESSGFTLNDATLCYSVTTDRADENKDKGVVIAWEWMWGDTASGLTAFAYRGVQDDPTIVGANDDRIVLDRFGVTAAQVWDMGFELQGGVVLARDNFKENIATQKDIDGRGWWGEVEQHFEKAKDLTIFSRYDQTDGNTDLSKNTRSKITCGLVWPVGDWHGRWALEVRQINQKGATEDLTTYEAVAEFMLNL